MKTKIEIEYQLMENQKQMLRALSATDSEFSKRLHEHIFQELKRARDAIAKGIKFGNGDPRGTANAVRRYTAQKYLGGVISLSGKMPAGQGSGSSWEPPRKLRPKQRGGNRRTRGKRTQAIMSYGGHERQFILHFVDAGTQPRSSGYGRSKKGVAAGNGRGNRGSIAPRNFTQTLGRPAVQRAMDRLAAIIDTEFQKIIKEEQ